jgi:hypothetical protein
MSADARSKANLGAVFQRVAILNGWRDHAEGRQGVELVPLRVAALSRGNQLGDNPPVGGDYNSISRLDSPDVPAEIASRVAYAGRHGQIIATSGDTLRRPPSRSSNCSASIALNRLTSNDRIRSAGPQG